MALRCCCHPMTVSGIEDARHSWFLTQSRPAALRDHQVGVDQARSTTHRIGLSASLRTPT